ncbi:MAG: TonB family protein [Acidobacteria bacterium]|nr:TonB family protein [Acidobacteriota bacterium]
MRDEIEFEMLLGSVLHEAANPEPAEGLERRVMSAARVSVSPVTDVLVLAGGLSSESIFASLWNGLREALFPRRLPPLVLESRPVAVTDRMAVDGSYSSTAYAVAVHAMAIFLIGFVVRAQIRDVDPVRGTVTPLIEPVLQITAKSMERSGGGGGQPGEMPVSKGHLPKLADQQIVPPSQPPKIEPKIAMEPTIVMQQVKLADNVMPNVGMPNSPLAGVSMGDGRGTGIGPGDGPGVGPGSGGNRGGGLRHVGGSVSMPVVIYKPEPEFSEEARKAKVSGDVTVYIWVDERGNPTHARVIQGIGMGLDEKALEAVKQYRFKPAMDNGKPVTVEMYVIVNFQIF